MKTFKQFVEELTTAEVPVTQQGPYRNSGMLRPFVARRKDLIKTSDQETFRLVKPSKRSMKFESLENEEGSI